MSPLRNMDQTTASWTDAPAIAGVLSVAARALMAYIFIVSGYGKVVGYDGTVKYMASMGVPGVLLPLVIALEIGGGIALLVGFQTRLVALALAVFCLVTAIIFHGSPDPAQKINFMKNLAMAGGFLCFVLNGAGPVSLDAGMSRRRHVDDRRGDRAGS